jgi:chromosome segregation ATPase
MKLLKQRAASFAAFFLLCSVLSWALPLPVYSLESGDEESGTNSGNELSRLVEISTRLGMLNETLRKELDGSRKSSAELALTLEKSKKELDDLKPELEALRRTSTELLNRAQSSETELAGLREALKKADSSLMSLELSFASYREKAEQIIARLEKERGFYRICFFIAAGLAAGGFAFGAAR